ncbi:MAG TPA: pyruvate kinase, partial [Candidatus Binatus sp.]|nr:pyruvate kinase [Candidatus Binatus sp.]
EDEKHLQFGLAHNVEIVAVSFVQNKDDIKRARSLAAKYGNGRDVFIVAKIEKSEAVQNLGQIVQESDGVMVARGDLGVELNLERVPIVQKVIIQEANRLGKPVITATQMLESMVTSPTPTRAEVTDTANAIIDGSDALMLAEETAIGKYPVEAVEVLTRVAEETERYLPKEVTANRRAWSEHSKEDALALAACETAVQIGARAIVAATRTGKTARRVSKYRSPLPIVALAYRPLVQRQLLLSWGVHPVGTKEVGSTEEIFDAAETAVVSLGLAKGGDRIGIIAGDPSGPSGGTEILKIQTVGRPSKRRTNPTSSKELSATPE